MKLLGFVNASQDQVLGGKCQSWNATGQGSETFETDTKIDIKGEDMQHSQR